MPMKNSRLCDVIFMVLLLNQSIYYFVNSFTNKMIGLKSNDDVLMLAAQYAVNRAHPVLS